MNYGDKNSKILIYDGDHPPPHCHVRRVDSETRVALPTLIILSGPELSKEERDIIIENMDELCEEFERKNPKKHPVKVPKKQSKKTLKKKL